MKVFNGIIIIFCISFFNIVGYTTTNRINDHLIKWEYRKNINIEGNKKYKNIFLDKEVYRYTQDNFSDIRIVDDQKSFVPYFIVNGYTEQKRKKVKYRTKRINTFKDKRGDSYFDFQIFPPKNNIHFNGLELSIDNYNYSKQVIIYARTSTTDWQKIHKDTIYRIKEYQKNKIHFNNTYNYTFYRIKVKANKENIDIKRCKLSYDTKQEEYYEYIKEIELDYSIKNEERETSVTIKNPFLLNIVRINLTINGDFNRRYNVLKKDTKYIIKSGKIYNFQFNDIDISNKLIDFKTYTLTDEKFLMNIQNQDDKPLKITKIKALYTVHKIVFKDQGSKSYTLYFGNQSAVKPQYDIINYKGHIEKQSQDQCMLGKLIKIKEQDKEKLEKASINYKIFFNILIVFISLVLVVFFIINLRKKSTH